MLVRNLGKPERLVESRISVCNGKAALTSLRTNIESEDYQTLPNSLGLVV